MKDDSDLVSNRLYSLEKDVKDHEEDIHALRQDINRQYDRVIRELEKQEAKLDGHITADSAQQRRILGAIITTLLVTAVGFVSGFVMLAVEYKIFK
jgi:chaperonin cofactor prefoldin